MNTGIFGEGFPYSNFHDLNMDWIIKIAKDFLDQYTNIQNIIQTGETDIEDKITSGLNSLDTKAEELNALLTEAYNTYDEELGAKLVTCIAELNDQLTTDIAEFQRRANAIIATLPDDFTEYMERVANTQLMIDTVVNTLKFYNLNIVDGAYIPSTSADENNYPVTQANYSYVRFYPCQNMSKIALRQNYSGSAGIAFYTNTTWNSYISGAGRTGNMSSWIILDVPASAKYVSISQSSESDYPPMIMDLTNFREKIDELADTILSLEDAQDTLKDNQDYLLSLIKFNFTLNDNAYIPYSSGDSNNYPQANTNWKYTSLYYCGDLKKIALRQWYKLAAGIAFYSQNAWNKFIVGYALSGEEGSWTTINIPDNADYFAMSLIKGDGAPTEPIVIDGAIYETIIENRNNIDKLNGKGRSYPLPVFPFLNKEINIIGDSISEGSGSTIDYKDSYVGILRNFFAEEFGGELNYGFCSLEPNLTVLKIDQTMMNRGTIVGFDSNPADGNVYGHLSWTNTNTNDYMEFSYNRHFNYMKVAYKSGNYGTFTVSVNGNTIATVNCASQTEEAVYSNLIDISDYPAGTTFRITATIGIVCVSGTSMIDNPQWWTLNNYSRAGFSIISIPKSQLLKEANCELCFYAHGTNGLWDEYRDYFNSVVQDIKSLKGNKIVLDTLTIPPTSASLPENTINDRLHKMQILYKFSKDINAKYISIYSSIPKEQDNLHIVSDFLVDQSHPTDAGHKFIAELVAKYLKLQINSKEYLTNGIKTQEIPYEDFTWNSETGMYSVSAPAINMDTIENIIVQPTNGSAILGARLNTSANTITVFGLVKDGTPITNAYEFKCTIIGR